MTPRSDILPLTVEPPLQFETERLCLRSVQPSDGQLLFELYGKDEEACRYMAFKREDSVDSVQRFVDNVRAFRLRQASEVRDFCWVIELKDGTPIGSCGFGPDREFSLGGGYILAKPFWGKGYATEALKCLLDWIKQQPEVFRFSAVHDVENPASGRVMEKAGMAFEGIMRRAAIHPNISDEPRDVALYAWVR